MGTTTTTDTSNQYNKSAMNAYNAFQPQIQSQLMQMAQNPLGNSYFQHQLAQQQGAAQQINQRSQSNSLQNLRTGGGILSNAGGYANALINRNQIQGSMLQSNAFNGAVNSALSNRNSALASMAAYQPLQTGQNSSQSTGGLGTWLPQLAGAGLNMLAPGLGSIMGGGGFSDGYGGPGQLGGSAAGAMSRPSMGGGGMQGFGAPPMNQNNPWMQNTPSF